MMEEVRLREGDEFIRLGQLLKKAGAVSSGIEAKVVIGEGDVLVNGVCETRRGRKLVEGDVVTFDEKTYRVMQ